MRRSQDVCGIVIFAVSLLTGCTTTEYSLYLQDVHIRGPVAHPPVHITDNNKESRLRISPHFRFTTGPRRVTGELDGHTLVDARGVYRVDTVINSDNTVSFRETAGENIYQFTGKNLVWRMPASSFGLDVDYTMSDHWALSMGATYSMVGGDGLWGYRAGLGLFSANDNWAVRIDGGAQWQELYYETLTAVVTRRGELAQPGDEVGFFRDKGRSSPMDFYAGLTFNSRHQDWSANMFFQIAVSTQSLAAFKPKAPEEVFFPIPFVYMEPSVIVHDERAEFSSTSVIITPGVFLKLDPTVRALVGVRVNHQTEIEGTGPDTMVLPFVQIDWLL